MNNTQEKRYQNPDNDPRGLWLLTDITAPDDTLLLRYEWNGYLPSNGRSWRFKKDKANALESEGGIIFSERGMPRLKRYLSEIEKASDKEVNYENYSKIEIAIRKAMSEIAKEIARNPNSLAEMEWRDLERILREIFELLGFTTELTRSGKMAALI